MKRTLLFLLFLCFPYNLPAMCASIFLEHAVTPEEKEWGLMGRDSLGEGQGMLFHYDREQRLSLWAFNCYFDLSIAFLDGEGVIVDIQDLVAHPEKMDPKRPVKSAEDIGRYHPNDPAVLYFIEAMITSRYRARYALEVPAGWFRKMDIQLGDRLVWKGDRGLFTPCEHHDGF